MKRLWILILLPLPLLAGCSRFGSYFNTFYFAKKYYAQAERIVTNSASDRLSPEAIKLYDKSIEKSEKVILKGGGWWAGIDDAIYLIGAANYGKRDYEEALRVFDGLLSDHPDSEFIPDALFLSGLCHHRRKEYALAEECFQRIATEYPGFERRDEILFLAGRGFEDDGEDQLALSSYEDLVEQFPKSKHMEATLDRIGEIHFEKARYDSSLYAFDRLAGFTRDDAVYLEANLQAGESLVRLGRYEEALNRYQSLLQGDPKKSQDSPRVWIHMAEAYNLDGRPEEALETLQKVLDGFGQSAQATEARFQIGYTYEVYLKDFEKARAAYQEASEMKVQSIFRDEAGTRLKNLQQIEELQNQAQSQEEVDRDARAEAAFMVAELLYLSSNRIEEALAKYDEVAEEFHDTDIGARAAYAVAWIQYNNPKSKEEGRSRFADIIQKYPGSPQADYLLKIMEEEGGADETLKSLVSRAKEEARLIELAKKISADSLAMAKADSIQQVKEQQKIAAAADTVAPGSPLNRRLPMPIEPGDWGRLGLVGPPPPPASPAASSPGPAPVLSPVPPDSVLMPEAVDFISAPALRDSVSVMEAADSTSAPAPGDSIPLNPAEDDPQ
ncbi:MAG: tetratricopeptide repeat protein [Candidatus Eisenbacteria bacterium]|uniref:Tetratricopeptide repeat protein n=1 Tax=Eiseniibacteriota bacterium TaxID=2212470 RepID=A0A948W564_UNCEI|nr:tetratricopeptide repeat protein [Candidatus Eisenbacteria bacterium]MBU1948934.1 tetratricopeptide repeat protein [Candidatus Eisenbacteria bacterium]MBU2689695.1 tetratricopeptide repeat protein [Candidatus Eisenbacteria bacterium]